MLGFYHILPTSIYLGFPFRPICPGTDTSKRQFREAQIWSQSISPFLSSLAGDLKGGGTENPKDSCFRKGNVNSSKFDVHLSCTRNQAPHRMSGLCIRNDSFERHVLVPFGEQETKVLEAAKLTKKQQTF